MLKLWGVVDYAPHMAAKESLNMRDGAMASGTLAMNGSAATYGDLDAAFTEAALVLDEQRAVAGGRAGPVGQHRATAVAGRSSAGSAAASTTTS